MAMFLFLTMSVAIMLMMMKFTSKLSNIMRGVDEGRCRSEGTSTYADRYVDR